MEEFDKIYLVWRPYVGQERKAVGVLSRKSDNSCEFRYTSLAKHLKTHEGFSPYTEFQDLDKTYNGNVAEIFGQRLTRITRPDAQQFLRFWEVDQDKTDDKFYLLGKTQGLVATDNFEFLAEYKLIPETNFVTEIAGLSYLQLPKGTVKSGDELTFKNEPIDSDPMAVKVFKDDDFIGYIKRYHNAIFHEKGANSLKLSVKAIEQNGVVRRIFVLVKCN